MSPVLTSRSFNAARVSVILTHFSQYDTCVCQSCRRFYCISSGNKPGLSLDVFNIDVKDHVASDLLVSDWVRVYDFTNFERDLCVLHLFCYGVLPQCIPVLLIKPNGLFDCLWDLDPEFSVSFVVLLVYSSDNIVSILEGKVNLPCKGWPVIDAYSLSLFDHLDRVGFLFVGKSFPWRWTVLLLYAKVPPLGGLLAMFPSTEVGKTIDFMDRVPIRFVIADGFHN